MSVSPSYDSAVWFPGQRFSGEIHAQSSCIARLQRPFIAFITTRRRKLKLQPETTPFLAPLQPRGYVFSWSLRGRTERGVYAASAWHNPGDVEVLPEFQESAHGEAA
jgi:hypothetical protein